MFIEKPGAGLEKPLEANFYSYVRGNPVTLIDDKGEFAILPIVGLAVTVGYFMLSHTQVANAPADVKKTISNPTVKEEAAQYAVETATMLATSMLFDYALGAIAGRGAANASKGVSTPHGQAIQSTTAEAQALLRQTQSGAPVYRAGRLGTQHGAEGQFWSFQNPASTSGYTGQMGMPSGGAGESFIMGGRVNPASSVVTRPAPGIGSNAGGAMEAVTPPGGVTLDWFHMP